MVFLEKYGLYIDEDLVVYRTYNRSKVNGVPVPNCYLSQMKWTKTYNGYLYCRHYYNGVYHSIYYHRLVAEAFIPNPENKQTVDHINRDKSDNRVCNLRWATHDEQAANRSNSTNKPISLKEQTYRKQYYLKNKAKLSKINASIEREKYAKWKEKVA